MLMKLEKVSRIYTLGDQSLHALDSVDFEVRQGDLLAVMGASGSGKSTMMNVLGCLDRPTSGRYLLDGQEVSAMSRDALPRGRTRTLGFVVPSFNLLTRTSRLGPVKLPPLTPGS